MGQNQGHDAGECGEMGVSGIKGFLAPIAN